MLGRFVTGWLCLETKSSCPDFWPVRSSGGFSARAEITPIQYLLCSVVRSSVGVGARAEGWFCKSAERVHSALEREDSRSRGDLG